MFNISTDKRLWVWQSFGDILYQRNDLFSEAFALDGE